MSTSYAGAASNGHRQVDADVALGLAPEASEQAYDFRRALAHRALPLVAFADTSAEFLLRVLPRTRAQIADIEGQARRIPDARLREVALGALAKRGNIEGAALFATLAPPQTRPSAIRALVAFQAAYNYTDALSELPSPDPPANADQLHQALLHALHSDIPHADYYAIDPSGGRDGGFLAGLVDTCRFALAELPRGPAVAARARQAAARIVDFQTLNCGNAHAGHGALERWAVEVTPRGSGLAWWECAAGAGSSLAVHALIAASADPAMSDGEAEAIERAYFTRIGVLHSLLDSLVDRREDELAAQPSLLAPYAEPYAILAGLTGLAASARDAAGKLPHGERHRAILTAMCSYYLSAPGAEDLTGRAVSASLSHLLGPPLTAAIWMFGLKRLAHDLMLRPYT